MAEQIDEHKLTAISPVDGRYGRLTAPLSPFFSEFALIKKRVEVELKFLLYLSESRLIRGFTQKEKAYLQKLISDFSLRDGLMVKKIENTTHHDVKAVEYFLREKFQKSSFKGTIPYLHIGLTSEDINNICWRCLAQEALIKVLLPELLSIHKNLRTFARTYRNLAMLGRTHGQAAIPTTMGKEVAVFSQRLEAQITSLKTLKFSAKFSGAVGGWNALCLAFPSVNLPAFSRRFVKSFGLEFHVLTTQIAPNDDIVELLQTLERINLVLINLNQDLWRYVSDGWLIQKSKAGQVGSSTMPQKVNPIDFENSEGNLFFANGIATTIVSKIAISRLQRDLSGSTVLRNLGVAFAHSLVGYLSLLKGLDNISPDKEKIVGELNSDWRILAEALQVILRKEGDTKAFEKVAALTKKGIWKQEDWREVVESFRLTAKSKNLLLKLRPEGYIGLSGKIVK
ncbi:MAG TPA: adenylosuccinate lyase [Patescibacteria group bacterium]|nr:adenylosuccinate lyase [Patescibacteria group bacterium]